MKVPTPVNSLACGCKFVWGPIRSKVLPVNLNQADHSYMSRFLMDGWMGIPEKPVRQFEIAGLRATGGRSGIPKAGSKENAKCM